MSKFRAFLLAVCCCAGFSFPSWAEDQTVAREPGTAAERKGMTDLLWDDDPAFRGMITFSYAQASDTAGPSTQGLRIGYGYVGARKDDYPWGEFWATFREDGAHDITAAGLSVVPVARLNRRFGLGPLFDLGVSRHRERGRSVYAGLIGTGVEGVVRVFRRWDLVTTVEAVYRTTSETELQGRVGIRFHHQKIPPIRDR